MSNPTNVPAEPVYSPPHAAPTNQPAAGVVSSIVSATPCRLLRLTVTNGSAAARYIQIFDRATAPSTGERPHTSTLVPAGQTYTFTTKEMGRNGITCSVGCVVSSSTRADSFAAGAADLTLSEAYIG